MYGWHITLLGVQVEVVQVVNQRTCQIDEHFKIVMVSGYCSRQPTSTTSLW